MAVPDRRRIERILESLVILAALATIPLTVVQERGAEGPHIVLADWLIWGVFVGEFVTMLALVESRSAYARRNLLSVAIIVLSFPLLPGLFALVRLARLARLARGFRLLRLVLASGRGFQGLRVVFGRKGLLYVASASLLLVVAGGGLLAALEPDRVEGGGFLAGVWWAVVTASTVGYGDIAPTSAGGRLVALVVMLAGIGLVSTLAASITAYFVEQDESEKLKEVTDRLDRIEKALGRLRSTAADGPRSRPAPAPISTATGFAAPPGLPPDRLATPRMEAARQGEAGLSEPSPPAGAEG